MSEILAFNRWTTEGISVADAGLQRYITLEPKIVPKTGARYHGNKFHKSRVFIVKRLINKVMIPGHKSKKHVKSSWKLKGKAHTAYDILENAAPREEIITIEYGGARYPKAVECAPQRRIDIALRLMTQGAYHKCFNSKRGIIECLSDELINAYKMDRASNAISKKLELERQSDASR